MPTREATVPEQVEARSRWHTTWASELTLAQFLREEEAQDAHPWAVTHRKHYIHTSPGEDTFVCSCEILLTESKAGLVWHLACLYTPPEKRGKGYANRLLEDVRKLAGASPVVLYSEIGAKYYEQRGFTALPGLADLVLPVKEVGVSNAGEGIRHIPVDANLMEFFSSSFPLQERVAEPGTWCLTLTPARMDWLCTIERFRAREGVNPPLACRGASTLGGSAACVWMGDFHEKELVILYLSAKDGDRGAVGLLLECAQGVAHAAGLERGVRVWQTDLPTSFVRGESGVGGVDLSPRPGKIPMVAMPVSPSQGFVGEWNHPERALWY